ncbi:lysine-specific histone demethylase 1, putative [Plasmodium malariae]|uniref:Lysine-specific histone demethylase 1, putative n=1 Tax=Plasmodium malariae TaxID=5858 RepID=A0A1C3KEN6_PLAMA|nr:lysine-specific histone demethylase 1, putative [Plasmodium malariae]
MLISKRRKKGNDIIGGVEMGETKIGRVNTERDSIGRGSSSRGPKWMDSGFRERRSGGIIHIPNNVMEEEVAESIILGKHENYEKEKKKRKEKKKISLFGQVKPVDLIRKGIDAYKILENEENLYVDVLIIGAGISGLAASYYLNKCNANFLVIEGRDRIGGRAFSTILPQRIINNKTLPETVVDLGANYLHCCDNADLLKEEVKKERDDNIFEDLEKEYYTEDEDMLASELKVNAKEKKGVRKNKPKNKVVGVEAAARTGASTGVKKKKKKKHKNYDATSNEVNNDNHLDQFDMNIMEGKLLNNIKLFKEEYIKLFSESNNPCFHDYINTDNMFKRCSTNLHSKIHCYTKDSTFSLRHFKNDEGGLYSEYDYFHTKNEKNRRKKKLKKSMLFMIRNNVDNICYLYKNYYKEKKKDIFNFLKSIDENIYLYNNLSDDTLLSSAPSTTINCTFKNENKKFKILSVNKDTRRRREYDKSLTQLAQKLKPKISLVCGKDNWESTFYAYWYNNENGKKIKSFKIYRINLLCDKIRVRAARKIRIFLFNANDSNANGSDASDSNTNVCEAEGGNKKEFVANLDAQTYDLPEMKVGCEKNMNMSEKKKKNSKYYIAGSKNGNMKKKVSTIDLDILNYDKDLIIYDNYYNYGEEYYKIVQAGNVCESGKKKNITKTVLYDDMNKRRSLWDLLMECTEEIFNEMNINRKNFSMEEWKMLMVTLQSRYGYGSDLRETSIAMSRLPFSSYMDIDICPNYGSNNYISKNIKYYDKIKKNEQTPHIRSFKDDSSADQIVLDGWKWIIDYLSKDIQNKIFINTVAELVQVKDEGKKKGKEEFFSHSNTKNEQTCQEKRYPNNGNNTNKHSNNITNMESYVVGSFSNYVLNVNIYAKYVIVAVPLGCLRNNDEKKKNMHRKTQLEFQPKLHPLKVKALNNYKMGNHNKIILRFYPFNFIWPFDSLQLNCIDQKFQFLNLHAYGKVGCVLVHCFPPWSCTYGYIKKEYFIVNECLYTLNKMFERSGKRLPILVDYIITKWQDDHFSCGSYAYPYVNCNDNDLIYLRSPHPTDNPKVVFCGEYLSKSYFQCVDGAYDTGIRAAEDIAHIGLKLRSYDTKYYNTDVFFFPDNTCPFTNIPLPRINNSLIGFYITDGSDEALTDYESSSDDEEGCISNIPSSVVKEEYEFLSYSLGKILQFFNNLKGQDVCKNRKEDKERKKRKQKEQIMKNETKVLEKKESLNNIYHSYKDEARTNEPLINYQKKCTYSGTDNHKSSYSDSNLDGNDKKNSGISSSIPRNIPESLSRNHPIDMCNKPNSKDDFPVGDIQYEGAEDSYMNERRDILIYDNPGTSENLKDSNSPMESNERTNMTSYIASNTVLAAHATCSSHVGENITSSLKGYPRKDANVKESIFLNKYYNNLDVYIDKYMVKFNDIVFRNYNNIELNLLRKKEDAVITPIFIKSKFLMCRSLSAVLNKYYRFQFFIQKELFSKVQEVKDELLHYFNFSNCKYKDILFCHEEKINDDIISDEKKEKNVVDTKCDVIFYEQARISSIIKEVDDTNHGTNMKGNIQFCADETHYVKRSNINDSVANDNIEKNSINGGFVEKDVIISNNKVNTSCLNSECKNDEYCCKNYEHDIINNVKTTKRNEECVNSVEINQKESVHKQLDIDKKKKKNLYIHNRRICQLNGYLKYVLNHILITKRFVEENIRNINNYNKIKLNSTDFVFFFCYLLQYIMKVINYDLYHNCIDYNIIIQLLCDYVYYLIFYKHDALCYKCMNGGELIICDFLNCANGWHSYCLSSSTDESENKLGSLWFCPECVSTNVSHVYKVICQNQK